MSAPDTLPLVAATQNVNTVQVMGVVTSSLTLVHVLLEVGLVEVRGNVTLATWSCMFTQLCGQCEGSSSTLPLFLGC